MYWWKPKKGAFRCATCYLIYSQETAEGPAPDEIDSLIRNHAAVMDEAAEKGVLLSVEGLKPTSTATSVRSSGGKAIATDGPFAETKGATRRLLHSGVPGFGRGH